MAFNRLFLAIPVPKEISLGIMGSLAAFAAIDGVRLTPVENYHVTVHFFGNIEEGETEALPGRLGRPFMDSSHSYCCRISSACSRKVIRK
jgi:2'-5' RNA ligase